MPNRPWSRPRSASKIFRDPVLPSLNFLLLTFLFTGSGMALANGWLHGKGIVLVFVVTGWVVSLCLHEFAHAYVAYRGGDWTIPETGYLTLDPLRYTHPVLSIALPLLYIVIGGFGLPGGAVYIDHDKLRSRLWDSAVSAAGPVANVVFLAFVILLYYSVPTTESLSEFQAAVAALAFLEVTAIFLNLIPLPGLDGFGLISPFLPGRIAAAGNAIAAGVGFLLVFMVLSSHTVQFAIDRAALAILTPLRIYGVYNGFELLSLF